MNNDKYIIMYCNNCVGTFNDLQLAKEQMELWAKSDFYLQKNEFSICESMEQTNDRLFNIIEALKNDLTTMEEYTDKDMELIEKTCNYIYDNMKEVF